MVFGFFFFLPIRMVVQLLFSLPGDISRRIKEQIQVISRHGAVTMESSRSSNDLNSTSQPTAPGPPKETQETQVSADMTKLQRARGSAKGRVTRVRRRIERELGSTKISYVVLQEEIERIQLVLAEVDRLSEEVRQHIETLINDESFDDQLQELDLWEENFNQECRSITDAVGLLEQQGIIGPGKNPLKKLLYN
eukprot:scpid89802/ scgid31838/ 